MSENTSHGRFIDFLRNFRRPYASIVCSSALAGGVLWGTNTGHFIPEGLGWVLAFIVVGDTAARAAEKMRGST
jgi:hypothetical protein